jgi:hypothetical protein
MVVRPHALENYDQLGEQKCAERSQEKSENNHEHINPENHVNATTEEKIKNENKG